MGYREIAGMAMSMFLSGRRTDQTEDIPTQVGEVLPEEPLSDEQASETNQSQTTGERSTGKHIHHPSGNDVFDLEEHLAYLRTLPNVKFGLDFGHHKTVEPTKKPQSRETDGMYPRKFPPLKPRP